MASESERRQAARIADEIRKLGERVVRQVVLNVHDELRANTPRATGYTAESWTPSVGRPYEGGRTHRGRPGVPAARTQAERGRAEVAGYRLVQGVVYISNNIGNALRLNDGGSSAEPAGFVQRAIAEGVRKTIL